MIGPQLPQRTKDHIEVHTKGVTTRTVVNSHLCVMIGASAALSQSQHIGVSLYLPVWLRPNFSLTTADIVKSSVREVFGHTVFSHLSTHLGEVRSLFDQIQGSYFIV